MFLGKLSKFDQIFKHYINPFAGYLLSVFIVVRFGDASVKIRNGFAPSDLESTRNSQWGMEMWGRSRCFFFFFFFLSFCLFWGGTLGIWRFPGQGSNWSCSRRPTPEPQQCQIQDPSRSRCFLFLKCQSLGLVLALILQSSGMLSGAQSYTVKNCPSKNAIAPVIKKYLIYAIFHR